MEHMPSLAVGAELPSSTIHILSLLLFAQARFPRARSLIPLLSLLT